MPVASSANMDMHLVASLQTRQWLEAQFVLSVEESKGGWQFSVMAEW